MLSRLSTPRLSRTAIRECFERELDEDAHRSEYISKQLDKLRLLPQGTEIKTGNIHFISEAGVSLKIGEEIFDLLQPNAAIIPHLQRLGITDLDLHRISIFAHTTAPKH